MKKTILVIFAIALTCICLRLSYVQYNIAHTPLEIGDIADAGYTHPGDFGHGNLYSENIESFWYIYDIPAPEIGDGKVRKICTYSRPENIQKGIASADIDFFFFDNIWYKIRTGNVIITGTKFIGPPNTKWKGWLSSKAVFPVDKPDLPYRLKIIWAKIANGSLSPKEYVEGLKISNPSCHEIPNI